MTERIADPADICDGFHTMAELYEQRMLWHAVAATVIHETAPGLVAKSWKHHDGEPCFGKTEPGDRWFIVFIQTPAGQVTQHYPEKDWDLFRVPEVETSPPWDGHTPEEGNRRLRETLSR